MIDKPGIYQISNDEYHADPCPEPSLSASGMTALLNQCPAIFWHQNKRLNPAAEREETQAMSVGRAAHTWILQGDLFLETVAVLPEGETLTTKSGKAFAAEAEDAGKTLIRFKEFEQIKAMREAVMRCEMAQLAFQGGAPEQSLFWQDGETGVWLRCRPDYLPSALRLIPDYKTARSCAPNDFRKAVREYGYHIQAAHYLAGIEAVTGEKPEAFFFVAQEKTAPYLVSICTLDNEALYWGRILSRHAIRIFADCLSRDQWPGYDENVHSVGLPIWASKEYEAMENMGLFAAPSTSKPEKDTSHEYRI